MKKFLPYAPLALLIIGTFSLQFNKSHENALLSDTLGTISGEVNVAICTKPEGSTEPEESAWCQRGLAADIKKDNNIWNWSCVLGDIVRTCTFEKTAKYPTRGGILFKK